ncbi:hypothetical protein OKW21_004435 [Catalinimonas alkaloidigena]|jgi:hypothetical protein|uniref:hypothetical protein n=1 Tax=Catalinimonas alkaloidigena TaxID=1075417 RepID=UPI00240565EA|nr:hypothetical protein [Catalinimonas alkaloidigena]MDF9799172.1 hypothetical protein [Catalinimonas alkaloidigena]
MDKLEYCKEILEKVSFDKELLRKEYEKALISLTDEKADLLDQWYKEKFENSYRESSDDNRTDKN